MNVIFCTSPFQVLVAREIARYTNLEFYGMYLLMSDDPRQKIYAEKMKEFCQEVCVLYEENLLETLQNFLFGKTISSLYLASLDNPVALSFFNPKRMQLFTFDDGSTSIIVPNMYTQNQNRIVSPLGLTLGEIMSLSQKHFTVFEKTELFEKGRQICLKIDAKPADFKRANNGKVIRVFLGQALGSIFVKEDIESTERLTKKALQDCKADFYYPHPRVIVEVEGVQVATPSKCFEEEVYDLLVEYEFVEVYGFYSTSFIFVKEIEGVKVQGYRTFLNSFESDVLQNYGVRYKNNSLSDICVDIVLPVLKGEETIENSIQSILKQTHQQFRLWIMDASSKPEITEICQKYVIDSRISYEKIENQSLLIAGIERTQGELIALQDESTVWLSSHLDYLLRQMESNPLLDIVGSKSKKNLSTALFGEALWYELAYKNIFNSSSVLFKKSIYHEAGGYQSNTEGFEDWHLWARMVTKENAYLLNIITSYQIMSKREKFINDFQQKLVKSRGIDSE